MIAIANGSSNLAHKVKSRKTLEANQGHYFVCDGDASVGNLFLGLVLPFTPSAVRQWLEAILNRSGLGVRFADYSAEVQKSDSERRLPGNLVIN